MNKSIMPGLLFLMGVSGCASLNSSKQEVIPQANTSTVTAATRVPDRASENSGVDHQPFLYRGNDEVVKLPGSRETVKLDGEAVTLNFEQAPITEVVHSVLGEILQLDYVIEHPLNGDITLRTRTPVPRDQLLAILESLLQSNGAVMVRDVNDRYFVSASGNLQRLIPGFSAPDEVDAGFSNIIVPLQHISASEMAGILKPLTTEETFVHIDNIRNLLVLAGTGNQIKGWMDIISAFDIDQLQGMSVGIFPLKYSTVEDISIALTHLLSSEIGTGLENVVRVMPLDRLNSILVVTPRAHYLDSIRAWINRLDQPQDATNEPTLHVYKVQNGTATYLAEMLGSIFGEGAGPRNIIKDDGVAPGLSAIATGQRAGDSSESFVPPDQESPNQLGGGNFSIGDNIRIVADEYNNSLLVYSPLSEFVKIEAALRQLDLVPTQVLIEASIIEVTLADELEYGVEWHLRNNLGNGHTGNALLNLGAGSEIAPQSPGFSYTVANSAGSLRAVINALAEKSLVNVISTPSIMVLDNRTAAIHVGDQQPVQSAQTITDGGTITSSIQYRDTGVKLQVTPSVNASGLVTMDILQSVTDIGPVDTATSQRSFLERNVSSQVSVPSGETVVLGGLIRDNQSSGKLGIPLLYSIPVVGSFFGRTAINASRTELLVFITPKVIKGQEDLRNISNEMRVRMKGIQRMDDLPTASMPAPVPAPKMENTEGDVTDARNVSFPRQ